MPLAAAVRNSLYLYLSACDKNTLCYSLEKKTCSATLSWTPHLPELLEGFSMKNVLKPMVFFSLGVVFCFHLSLCLYFHRLWGTLILLLAFSSQTSSHALRGYNYFYLRRKSFLKNNDLQRVKMHSVDCLWSLEIHPQFRVFLGHWFFCFGGGGVQTYAPVLLHCVSFCFLISL